MKMLGLENSEERDMVKEESKLKEKLFRIKKSNYLLEEQEDYFSIGLEMMENIGSLDPQLRDELIYTTLFHWITQERFDYKQLRHILQISLDNSQLFNRIEERDDDAVFKRTFSVLIVALILYEHRKINFLSREELDEVKEKLIEYMIDEVDVRGYVEVKGWAHSAAHTADALDELVQCDCINKSDLLHILNVIRTKVCIGYYVYVDEESERLVNVVESSLSRKILIDSEIIEWLQGFKRENQNNKYIHNYHLKINIKEFLRSLYFRLLEKENSDYIVEEIKKMLRNL